MNRGAWRFLLLCFLFVFGLLVGLETKRNNVAETDARDTFIDASQYITRIENGQLIFAPVHQQGIEKPAQKDVEKIHVSEQIEEREVGELIQDGPKMNKKGKLDQIGQKLGSKFSQLARATLEMSFSFITK